MHLDRCLRLFPADNDTGGFFIAILHKHQALPRRLVPQTSQNTVMEQMLETSERHSGASRMTCLTDEVHTDLRQLLQEQHGIIEGSWHRLWAEAAVWPRGIYLAPAELAGWPGANVVQIGTQVFGLVEEGKGKEGTAVYRVRPATAHLLAGIGMRRRQRDDDPSMKHEKESKKKKKKKKKKPVVH